MSVESAEPIEADEKFQDGHLDVEAEGGLACGRARLRKVRFVKAGGSSIWPFLLKDSSCGDQTVMSA